VTTLHGAVTFCQIDRVPALTVSQHLNFDVAWVFQVFSIISCVAESRFRFRFGHGDGLRQFSIAAYYAHTRPPPPPDALMITG
jgi:hypothetical protein